MRKENIFVVGGQATGASFFGRKEELKKLTDHLRSNGRGRAIVGLNRIGKSSLVDKLMKRECEGRTDIVYIKLSVYDNGSSQDFWKSFTKTLHKEIQRLGIRNDDIDKNIQELLGSELPPKKGLLASLRRFLGMDQSVSTASVQSTSQEEGRVNEFNTKTGSKLKEIMEQLGVLNYRVVIVLEEFDAARKLFRERPGSLSLIRNMATVPELKHVAVFTVSRRSLQLIEKGIAEVQGSDSTSTLSGAIDALRIKGFSDKDMEDYWDALTDYDLFSTEELKEKIQYYTGYQPWLLSLFGNRMAERLMGGAEITPETIDKISSKEWLDNVKPYYETMLERMREDGWARDLRGILCGPIDGITKETVESLLDGGYLDCDEDGFYTISRHFNRFFIHNTMDISSPIWDMIMESERLLKSFLVREYPKLEKLRYSDIEGKTGWANDLNTEYPTLKLDEKTVERNMKRTHNDYDSNPTIIESLMLSYVVRHILKEWTLFRPYFNNEAVDDWQRDMNLVARARNALAHACPDYLKQYETDMLSGCCQRINALNQKRI